MEQVNVCGHAVYQVCRCLAVVAVNDVKQASCLLLDQCMSVAHITTYKMKNTWQIKLIITIQLVFKN